MDPQLWAPVIFCLGTLAVYCRGAVGIAQILAYPHVRGIPVLLGGIEDAWMPKTRRGRLKGAVVQALVYLAVVSVWPLLALLTLTSPGNNVFFQIWATVQVMLAVAWTAWLVRWTRRKMRDPDVRSFRPKSFDVP